MTLLLREPEVAKTATEAPPAPVVAERACGTCGATMAPDQDWCLECGTAAPGRLGTRPGLRAAATAVGLTLLLAGGAVAASYAALSSDAHREASRPAPPDASPVAQVPATPAPVTAVPGTPVPSTTAPAVTPPSIAPGTTPPTATIPKITVPPVGPPAPTTQINVPSTPTVTPTPTRPTTTTPSTTRPTTTASTKPQPIDLGADSVSLYDPYNRAEDKGDPADAYDNSTDSAWHVTTPLRSGDMGIGLVVDLEKARAVKVIELLTDTPGFRIELYAATGNDLPPDVLDTRWAHVKNRSRVDETKRDGSAAGDGQERIVLGAGTAKYRYVLLWFTTPPDDGPTVEIADLKLLA